MVCFLFDPDLFLVLSANLGILKKVETLNLFHSILNKEVIVKALWILRISRLLLLVDNSSYIYRLF
jgi:hypothetical protein